MSNSGLDGVVAADTRLSLVNGEQGRLLIGGFPVESLAPAASFEEVLWLLWRGELPDASQLAAIREALARARDLAPATIDLLQQCAQRRIEPMDALRMAVATLSLDTPAESVDLPSDAVALVARFPTIVAAYQRALAGDDPIAPDPALGHAANFLQMLRGESPDAHEVRALETYLNTVVDHGLNASTFTARVIISTGSDMVSAVTGAVGALKGPLHGGAPGPALSMVFEIADASRAEVILRAKLERGERLMGFGHRIYRVRDPRADVLGAAAERLFSSGRDRALYDLARNVERTALRLLEEAKPGRRLQTNVEFYTALLLHGIGIDVPLFTPIFAIARVAGWTAHALEQRANGRIIRPQSAYVGPPERTYLPMEARTPAVVNA